jgi:PAS domain S-box-containing protein
MGAMMRIIRRMTLLKTSRFVSLFILVIQLSNAFASNNKDEKRNVLVVNSYHHGYTWSDGIMAGIQNILKEDENIELIIEYLDAKRYSSTPYFQLKKEDFRFKYMDKKIDVILLNDDHAFDFVKDLRNDFLSGVPVVFVGIDHYSPELIIDQQPIHGLTGGRSIKGTVDLILKVHPDIQSVVFISDGTKTGINMVKTVKRLESDYSSKVTFKYLVDMTVDELFAAISMLPSKTVVFLLIYIKDRTGKVYTINESFKMMYEASNVPVYSAWGFSPGVGSLGGKIHRGYETGELMAEIAQRILRNEPGDTIPTLFIEPLVTVFDYNVMQRFDLDQDDVPSESVIYNMPVSMYQKYKVQIWIAISFVLLLVFSVVYLLVNILKRRKAEHALQKAHVELEQKVEDRTKELSNANEELNMEIEERRRSEKLFTSIFELSPNSLCITNLDGRFILVNKSFTSIFGYAKNEVIGKSSLDLNMWLLVDQNEQMKDKLLKEGKLDKEEIQFRLKNGEIIDTELSTSIIEVNNEPLMLSEVINVTDRKRVEVALKDSEAKLRESNNTKDKFFSIIAHDLKSPFQSILGCSEILEMNHKEYNEEKRGEIIKLITMSAKRAYGLLENLLTWSRSQSGMIDYKPEKLQLNVVLLDTIFDLQVYADQKDIKINNQITNDELVFADKNMISTILRNLISNAIKFTQQNGIVTLGAQKTAETNFTEIWVKDTGIGIPKDIMDNLFRIDKKVFTTSGTANEKGTGLGLILCKEFVEKHGGEIRVESKPEKGSIFSFTIPNKINYSSTSK